MVNNLCCHVFKCGSCIAFLFFLFLGAHGLRNGLTMYTAKLHKKGHAETTLLSYKIVSFKSNDRLIINVTLNGQWMQSWWASDEVIWYWLKQLTVIVKVKCINLQNYALYPPRHDFAQKHQLLQIPYHPPTDESDVILNMKLMHMSQPPFLSYIATLSI